MLSVRRMRFIWYEGRQNYLISTMICAFSYERTTEMFTLRCAESATFGLNVCHYEKDSALYFFVHWSLAYERSIIPSY